MDENTLVMGYTTEEYSAGDAPDNGPGVFLLKAGDPPTAENFWERLDDDAIQGSSV